MNRLTNDERSRVVACLVEGNSQRATVRITGVCKRTVARLAVELGEACQRFMDSVMVDLPCEQIQCVKFTVCFKVRHYQPSRPSPRRYR